MWSYRIKASPWFVFGIVKWYIKPVNVAVHKDEVYAANMLTNEVIGHGQEVRANGPAVRACLLPFVSRFCVAVAGRRQSGCLPSNSGTSRRTTSPSA